MEYKGPSDQEVVDLGTRDAITPMFGLARKAARVVAAKRTQANKNRSAWG